MDPEATLERIMRQLRKIATTDKATADELAESIHDMIGWLANGGYAPGYAKLIQFADSLWEAENNA